MMKTFSFLVGISVKKNEFEYFYLIPANGAWVKNHQPVDLRESTSGGVSSEHHAGAVWLGSSHYEPASYPTLQISGKQNSYFILCFSLWNLTFRLYPLYIHECTSAYDFIWDILIIHKTMVICRLDWMWSQNRRAPIEMYWLNFLVVN